MNSPMAMADLLLLFFISILTIIIMIFNFTSHRNCNNDEKLTQNKQHKLPPGKMAGWPLIGQTIAFMQPHSSASLGEFLEKNVARYGSVFRMNLLGKSTIISTDPEFNRFILQNEGKLFENSCPTSIAEIMGRWSMLAQVGELHRELRFVAVNFMSSTKLKTYFLSDIERQASKILNTWKENSTFSALEEGKKFAFGLMVKHLMSMDEGMQETKQLREEYITFMNGMASIPINLPGTAYRKALQSRAMILRIMGHKLDERMKKLNEGCIELVEQDDLLASVTNYSSVLTRDQILDLLLSMLFAGHETTSAAISLAIYFLQSCPKALHQLQEEHREIARQKKEKDEIGLNWDDYKQMEFTHCVINETLRLGNIVKFLHRRTIKDVQFKEYEIPCGWEIIPVLSAAHLNPSIYNDPQTYNPWRWESTTSSTSKTKKNTIMSFSGGPRLCPGAELAKLEMAIFLHYLVQMYEWELAENDYPVSFPFLGFIKGLPIKVRLIST